MIAKLAAMTVSTASMIYACAGPPTTRGGGDDRVYTCQIKVTTPVSTRMMEEGSQEWMVGSVTIRCFPLPESHRTVIKLQKRSGGQYYDVFLSEPSHTIPPKSGRTFAVTSGTCISGRWRMQIKARGRAADGTPFDETINTTSKRIRCKIERGGN